MERDRLKQEYWANMLNEEKVVMREYEEVYDQLYQHFKIRIENSMRPLKEYYYSNPQAFDP